MPHSSVLRSLRKRWWLCLAVSFRFRGSCAFRLATQSHRQAKPPLFQQRRSRRPSSNPVQEGRYEEGDDRKPLLYAVQRPASTVGGASSAFGVDDGTLDITIEPVTFQGLRAVAKLLVEAFYGSTIWFPAQFLIELQRLQDNFHSYEDDAHLHLMLVATSREDGSLAGFVDVDGRENRPSHGVCRPYLSDLAVSHQYRRKGIGTELVRACEKACLSWGFETVYLKVHAGNAAAETLYENLGYERYSPINSTDKKEVMLCCNLRHAMRERSDCRQQDGSL